MPTVTEIFNRISKYLSEDAAREIAVVIADVYSEMTQKMENYEQLVTKDEFAELRIIVKELAVAQRRTEERLSSLIQRVDELAEAQRRTEMELTNLVIIVKRVQKELGGISNTIGYTLENEAFKALPRLLMERCSIQVKGRLLRRFIEYPDSSEDEVNIFGEGTKDGKQFYIVGESKSQLSTKHVDKFLKLLGRLETVLDMECFPLMVTHSARPKVLSDAESKGIVVFFSYEF